MKTQVIQLDPHDDVVSVRDKMKWTKTPRLLLVFPPTSAPLFRTLDLLLLRRHAAALGVRIALAAASAEVCRAAQEAGLPVFARAEDAQRADWPEERPLLRLRRRPRPDLRQMRRDAFPPEPRWRSLFAFRILFFSLAVLAILSLLLVFLPSAEITLSPALETQQVPLILSARAGVTAVSAAGEVPARRASVSVEGSRTIAVTGTASVPDQPAEGIIRFTNLTLSVVGIPAGTVVRTQSEPPVRFVTLEDGVLGGIAGRTLDLPARALEPGTAGNLPAGALVVIEGGLGASLSASNPEAMTGGSDRLAAVPSADDRDRLRAALLADLRRQAVEKLTDTLGPGSVVFPDTIQPTAPLVETWTPPPGEAGEKLTLTLAGEFEAQYAAGDDLRALGGAVLDAHLPPGYESLPETLTFRGVGQPATDADGATRWAVTLTRSMRLHLDSLAAAQLVQGRRPPAAAEILAEHFALTSPPEIRLSPSFWLWLPLVPLRIAIIIK